MLGRMEQATFVWFALITAAQVGGIIANIVSIRRKPSIPEELYRDYATKKELFDLRNDFNKTMNEFFNRQHINQASIEDRFQAIMRSVGRIEGAIQKPE
jgi:hypothetical protein